MIAPIRDADITIQVTIISEPRRSCWNMHGGSQPLHASNCV